MSATIDSLKKRAGILSLIREFFSARNVWEVETPLLCSAPVTDPYLSALSLQYQHKTRYLQTSPEYAMKRLLTKHSGDIYQLCKAFRSEESGKRHLVEFTLLEWYRIGFDHHQLMSETDQLLQAVIQSRPAQKISYQEIFQEYIHINPHQVSKSALQEYLTQFNITINTDSEWHQYSKDDYLDLLFSHVIEPKLLDDFGPLTPVFITDYPASQAALAKTALNKNQEEIAERFEVFINGIELANGYHELQDPPLQRKRFEADLQKRSQLGLPEVPIDEYLLSDMEKGLPSCAGIALGIDRLVMIALNKNQLSEVVAFDGDHC